MSALEEVDPELLAAGLREAHWRRWHRHLRIADRTTNALVPYTENAIQRRLSARLDAAIDEDRPFRAICLKSRRMGVSTWVQMRYFHLAAMSKRWTAITGAHEARSSEFIHGMVETAYDHLPAEWKRPRSRSLTGRTLEFAEGAGMQTFTAGSGEGAGRGTGFMAIHASEVAFWENAAGLLLALRQLVPESPGTSIFLESTANGIRNVFRDEWVRAIEGRSIYEPLFFAWFEFPDYRMALPDWLELERMAPAQQAMADMSSAEFWRDYPEGAEDEEEGLRAAYGLSDEQLYWRRYTIQDKCGSDIDKFHQEYPSNPEEAFLSSGRPFVPPKLQTLLAKAVTLPRGVGDLTGEPIRNGRVAFEPVRFGPLHVYEPPNGDPHIIGADTAGGITEEEESQRERREGDYCAYVVINLRNGRVVAEFQKRTDADVFATDLARAGWIYQDREQLPAEIAVESNNMGLLTLSKLRDELRYPRIYHRESLSHEHRGARTRTIGWNTTLANRGAILAGLLEIIRDHPDLLPSGRLLAQIRTLVWKTDKRVEHELGAHDDIVMCTAIGFQLWRMRTYYVGELPKEQRERSTVEELEAWAMERDAGDPIGRLREQALRGRGSTHR